MQSRHRQSGTVLFVVVVLLLLAGILSLVALNMSVFEQRASGNDLREKLVTEVASAGLTQGMEYLHQHPTYITDTGKWSACTKTNTSFPCGSVPVDRRATMSYWNSGGYDFDGSGTISGWETRMIPIPTSNVLPSTGNVVASTGNGFPAQYGVGAVLCRVAAKTANSDPTVCTDSASATSTSAITFVSVAALPGEGARTTVTQTVGVSSLLDGLGSTPPLLASGSVDVTGGLQLVTNPNSGGTGMPVSVWSRKALTKTGTPNTCYYNEFLHNSSGSTNGTIYLDAASPNYPLCDNCNCGGADSLTYTNSGNKVDNGIDILQNSGVNSDYTKPLAAGYANYDVLPQEFPCDLFQQIFHVKAWDDPDGDYFCERKIMTTYKNPNTGVDTPMGVDEAYLFQNSKTIINPTTATTSANLAREDQKVLTTYPSDTLSGLVWCQQSCNVNSNEQVGTAAKPVLLVVDGPMTIKGKIFGIVVLRTKAGGATLTPISGYTMSTSEIASGGNADLEMHGGAGSGAVVYGSVVVQGTATKLNGSNSIVYNNDIIIVLQGQPSLIKFDSLPGGWSDRVSY